jgi:4-amino-4-deoxy-L-arabinose transferase-like glycosyltransferase
MPSPKINPPFAWLGRRAAIVSLLSSVLVAAFFRFFRLDSLPPALYGGTASTGLQAAALADHGHWPGLSSADGFAPLIVVLQALPVKLLGHTELALRLWPALLGTLAVLLTWLWVRSWFGLRLAWLASLLLAVTPWAVTLSRTGLEAGLYPFLTVLTLWTGTVAWRRRSSWGALGFGLALTLNLLSGPVGWLLAGTTIMAAVTVALRSRQLLVWNRQRALAYAGLAVGIGLLAYLVATSHHLADITGVTGFSLSTFGSNAVKTLLMFNVHGDDNFRHNLPSEPLLNAFVGLMFVAGLLVSISRLHERRYRLLLLYFVVLLLPALLSNVGVPNAARAAADLPIVVTMAAVGISYMLELWYRTFPINSAARATGQAAILVLLGLTVFQGYTQYFRAWANSTDMRAAYHEGATKLAHLMLNSKATDPRFVVATAPEQPTVEYLVAGRKPYTAVETGQMASLPVGPGTRRFYISATSKDDAVKYLKLKFPGGVLRPIPSDFNQIEIAYVYEVTTK